MNTVITVLLAVLVFGLLIFIHELGHFLTAKACGVKVNEFALGMGPTIFKINRGETKYALRLFPIGGFVSMEGEEESSQHENAFCNKPVWKRILIVCAGAFMNIILGFVVMIFLVSLTGGSKIATTTVSQFRDGAVSSGSGLQVGDRILKINDSSIFVDYDIIYALMRDDDGIVSMQVKRDGQKITLKNVTFQVISQEDGVNNIFFDFTVTGNDKTAGAVLRQAFFKTFSVVKIVWSSVMDLITGKFSMNQLSGPVGVATAIGDASKQGADSFFMMVVFITVNLGVFNLLPLPALDGGRLIFLIIEGVRRKPVNPKYEGYVHFAGFALLILLMVFVTYHDIVKLIQG